MHIWDEEFKARNIANIFNKIIEEKNPNRENCHPSLKDLHDENTKENPKRNVSWHVVAKTLKAQIKKGY